MDVLFQEACEKLRERLDRHAERCDEINMSWEQLVKSAYEARVNLSASGFYMYVHNSLPL